MDNSMFEPNNYVHTVQFPFCVVFKGLPAFLFV